MRNFDWKTAPLDRSLSLEASAGTGKTYTLERLYCRLITEKKLPMESILTVTFTNKAARELEERIRALLWENWKKASGEEEGLLRKACLDFDKASIYTIHSFCKQILGTFSFEMGTPFMLELDQDELLELEELRDWFRKNQDSKDPLVTQGFRMALDGKDLDHLLGELRSLQKQYATLSTGTILPSAEEDQHFRNWLTEEENELTRLCRAWDEQLDKSRLYDQFVEEKLITRRTNRSSIDSFLEQWNQAAESGFHPRVLLRNSAGLFQFHRKNLKNPPDSDFIRNWLNLSEALEELDARWTENWKAMLVLRFQWMILQNIQDNRKAGRLNQSRYRFDDLIESVHQSLCGDHPRTSLLTILRDRYRVLLIDEFQDTDQRQWDIFRSIFAGSPGHQYFLIGDPKQSIYRFRGADLNVYFRAVEELPEDCRYQLNTNYRSTPRLMECFNRIFHQTFNKNQERPIRYRPVQAGASAPALSRGGEELGVLHFTALPAEEKFSIGDARNYWMNAIADQAVELLQDPELRLGEEKLQAGDLAVLMENNRDCLQMQSVLQARGIPAVISGDSDIFNSPAFPVMLHFLRFLANPSDMTALRFLMLTPLFRMSAAQLNRLEESGGLEYLSLQGRGWKKEALELEELFDRFSNQGRDLFRFLSDLLPEESLQGQWLQRPGMDRLLYLDQGERIYTDMLHLLDLFQQERVKNSMDFHQLSYLAGSDHFRSRLEEEKKLRLEREGQVVQIMTLHSSKGLQFPLVFFAGALKTSLSNQSRFLHYTRQGKSIYSALKKPEEQVMALDEDWQERLKLYYVAFTRAKSRLYLPWFQDWDGALLSQLYHSFLSEEEITPAHLKQSTGKAKKALQAQLSDSTARLIQDLQEHDPSWVEVQQWQPGSESSLQIEDSRQWILHRAENAPFDGRIRRMSSFSALTRQAYSGSTENQSMPEEAQRLSKEEDLPESEGNLTQDKLSARDLPGGANPGTLVHDCFEEMDFQWPVQGEDASEEWDNMMQNISLRYFPASWYFQWKDALKEMLSQTLQMPLDNLDGFRLCDLPAEKKVHELEFLMKVSRGDIHFADHRWELEEGYLKGYLDMIFIHQGKYYILDWKTTSNPSHPLQGGYSPSELDHLMEHHHYKLQAMIYWSALRRYLKLIQGDAFDPDSMGGIFYLFLRGMDQPGEGVWFHRPSEEERKDFESRFLEEQS